MNNQFQILDIYVSESYLVIEYITTFGVHRFDMQSYIGGRNVRLTLEISPGIWERKDYPIELLHAHSK